jgi:hypothetical protein
MWFRFWVLMTLPPSTHTALDAVCTLPTTRTCPPRRVVRRMALCASATVAGRKMVVASQEAASP